MSDTMSSTKRFGAEHVIEAAALLSQGPRGRERAAMLLLQRLGGRLQGYFVFKGRVPEPVAEELVSDVIMLFVTKPLPRDCPADVWLWTMARNTLIDWARQHNALKRGGSSGAGRIETELDDDAMLALLETTAGDTPLPAWVRDCVHRAAFVMQHEEPRQAEVLRMVAEGWTAEEVSIHFGALPGQVTERQKTAARDRIYRACQCARGYFQHCKE